MASRVTHAQVGALVGGGVYIAARVYRRENPTIHGLLLAVGIGAAAGCLPDILEPAQDPNHRKAFHSVAALVLAACGAKRTWESPRLDEKIKIWTLVAVAGYASHLGLDSLTPKGLPSLGIDVF